MLDDPMLVEPFLKVTVPVGIPLPGELAATVAVNVTGWPKAEGLAEELKVVVEASAFTVWPRVVEALPLKLVSPL